MNIYRIITDANGNAKGGYLVWSNVNWISEAEVEALALEMTRLTNWVTCYEARRCTAPRYRIVDGVVIRTAGAI